MPIAYGAGAPCELQARFSRHAPPDAVGERDDRELADLDTDDRERMARHLAGRLAFRNRQLTL